MKHFLRVTTLRLEDPPVQNPGETTAPPKEESGGNQPQSQPEPKSEETES